MKTDAPTAGILAGGGDLFGARPGAGGQHLPGVTDHARTARTARALEADCDPLARSVVIPSLAYDRTRSTRTVGPRSTYSGPEPARNAVTVEMLTG
jgi:hypothetical protein